jgi:hypothetical protein
MDKEGDERRNGGKRKEERTGAMGRKKLIN